MIFSCPSQFLSVKRNQESSRIKGSDSNGTYLSPDSAVCGLAAAQSNPGIGAMERRFPCINCTACRLRIAASMIQALCSRVKRLSKCHSGKIRRFLLRCPEPWVVDFPGRSLLILSARSIIIAEFLYSPIGIHRSVSRYVFLMAGEERINVLSLSG